MPLKLPALARRFGLFAAFALLAPACRSECDHRFHNCESVGPEGTRAPVLSVGDTLNLRAFQYSARGDSTGLIERGSWASHRPNVASVGGQSGIVRAWSAGQTIVVVGTILGADSIVVTVR